MNNTPFYKGGSDNRIRLIIASAGLLAVLVIFVAGFGIRGLFLASPTPTVEPCQPESPNLKAIRLLRAQGQYDGALALAKSDLAAYSEKLCLEARVAVVKEGYYTAIDGLFAKQHVDGDIVGGHDAVVKWQEIEAFGDKYQLPDSERQPVYSISQQAYDHHYYELAKEAWTSAWNQKRIRAENPVILRNYYAAITNLGYETAYKGPENSKQTGMRWLNSACQISRLSGLGGEACKFLSDEAGYDESKWPEALSDPVLEYLKKTNSVP